MNLPSSLYYDKNFFVVVQKTESFSCGKEIIMIGLNGKPVVLPNLKYDVDVDALERYASSEEAMRAASADPKEFRAELTEREIIQRFLHNVSRDKDGKRHVHCFIYEVPDRPSAC